jgi:hypothetical protein
MTWIKKGIIFDKEWAQLPVVDVYPDFYKIYYSTRDEQGRSIPKCFIVTKDFERELYPSLKQPSIPLGKPGSFDSHGVMPSSIVTLKNGTKYMYYVGWSKRIDVPYWNSTGLAISKDNGVTWEKYSEGPILSSNSKEPNWIGTVYAELCVNKFDEEEINLFYSSCKWENIENKFEPTYGINFAYYSLNEFQYNECYPIIKLKNNEGGIASFRRVEDRFFYSKRNKSDYKTNPENSYKIYSCNLEENNEQLELEPSCDELMCAYPFVIEEEDKYIMFYNSDFGKSGISYAIKYK